MLYWFKLNNLSPSMSIAPTQVKLEVPHLTIANLDQLDTYAWEVRTTALGSQVQSWLEVTSYCMQTIINLSSCQGMRV